MTISIHFQDGFFNPIFDGKMIGSFPDFPCEKMQVCQSRTLLKQPVIRVTFTPKQLEHPFTKHLIGEREILEYGDSDSKYVEFPISETYSTTVSDTPTRWGYPHS